MGPLFDWCGNGEAEVPSAVPERWTFRTSEASARHPRDSLAGVGALVQGRRLFDVAGGWGGRHPLGTPGAGGSLCVRAG